MLLALRPCWLGGAANCGHSPSGGRGACASPFSDEPPLPPGEGGLHDENLLVGASPVVDYFAFVLENLADETVTHTQCWCPALKEARIAAHHAIFNRINRLIVSALTKQSKKWEALPETEVGKMDIPHRTDRRRRRPDLTLVNRHKRKVFFVEFSRTWDDNLEAIRTTEKAKKAQYQMDAKYVMDQWPDWQARVIPIVVGVRGKTREKSMHSYLRRMHLPRFTRLKIQRAASRGAITQMSKIMQARWGAMREATS